MTKSPTRPTGSSGAPGKGGDETKAAASKAAPAGKNEPAGKTTAASKKPDDSKVTASGKASPGKPAQAKPDAAKAAPDTRAGSKAETSAAPGPQPSPSVTRNPERVARAKTGSPAAPPPGGGPGASGLVTAGLIGGLLAGAAFIAYDLLLRPAPDADTRLAAIEERIDALATDVAPPALPDDLAERLDALESQADEALSTAREAAERPVPDAPDVSPDAIDANTAAIESLQSDVSDLQGGISGLQTSISDLQDTVSGLQAEVPMEGRIAAATRASAADYILGALVDGRPYEQALDVLRGQDVSEDALAALEPFATEGAPRPYILAGRLAAVLAGEEPPPEPTITEPEPGEGAGFLQLFVDRAITVERVDEPRREVDSQAAQPVIAALEYGDTQAALTAWQALDADAQAQSADFGETLDQLVAARAAALDIAQAALTALAHGR